MTSDWNSVLNEAAHSDDEATAVATARTAIAHGADPNYIAPDENQTVLFWAAFGKRRELVRTLIELGARADVEPPGESNAIHAAVENHDLETLRLLLKSECRVALNGFDYLQRTPLAISAELDDLESARLLLAAGADVNRVNESFAGDSPLHDAAREASLDMVTLLLEAGADPWLKGWMWLTPIDSAMTRAERSDPTGLEIVQLIAKRLGTTGEELQMQLSQRRHR